MLIRFFVSGVTWSVRASSGKLCSSSHVGFHVLLCDVTALARSWTSSDGWFQGERPADRRALEGAVAKAGSVSFERFQRVQRFKRASAHSGTSFLTVRFWTSPTGGWSNQSVGTGRSPACKAFSFPALLPFGRSCYCSALCSLFLFFSQIFLRFLLQQISTVLKQHIFWKKRTFCLPLPAVYIPETDKYSCLHSNR